MKIYSIKQSRKADKTVETNTLTTDIYSYTLIVDYNAPDVKQMIIAK